MRDLARLRMLTTKLKTRKASDREAIGLLEESLSVSDRVRSEAASLMERCVELERELIQQERNLHSLFDALPMPIVTTDRTGIIVEANRAAATLLGRSASRLQYHLLLHFAEDREAFSALIRELPHARGTLNARLRLRPQERAPFDADITVMPDTRDLAGHWLWFLVRRPPYEIAAAS